MATKFIYDKEYDNLIISNKEPNEKVKNNYMFDDFIISVTGRGKIVSLEILDVSSYFKQIGFDPKILNSVKNVELIVNVKKDFISIGFSIFSMIKKKIDKKMIPIANLPASCLN